MLFRDAASKFQCALTAISLYELQSVPRLSVFQLSIIEQLRKFVEVLPFDAAAAEQSASIWRSLALQGQTIGLADTLIAGVCLANDLPLLTRNVEHYGRIAALKLISADDLLSQPGKP